MEPACCSNACDYLNTVGERGIPHWFNLTFLWSFFCIEQQVPPLSASEAIHPVLLSIHIREESKGSLPDLSTLNGKVSLLIGRPSYSQEASPELFSVRTGIPAISELE